MDFFNAFYTHSDEMVGASQNKQNHAVHRQLGLYEMEVERVDGGVVINHRTAVEHPVFLDSLYRELKRLVPRNSTLTSLGALREAVDVGPNSTQDRATRAVLANFFDFIEYLRLLARHFREKIYDVLHEHFNDDSFRRMKDAHVRRRGEALERGGERSPNNPLDAIGELCWQQSFNALGLKDTVDSWAELLRESSDIDPALFDENSAPATLQYGDCGRFRDLLRLAPDVMNKTKMCAVLAKAWWYKADKIRRLLAANPATDSGLSSSSEIESSPPAEVDPPRPRIHKRQKQSKHPNSTAQRPTASKKKAKSKDQTSSEAGPKPSTNNRADGRDECNSTESKEQEGDGGSTEAEKRPEVKITGKRQSKKPKQKPREARGDLMKIEDVSGEENTGINGEKSQKAKKKTGVKHKGDAPPKDDESRQNADGTTKEREREDDSSTMANKQDGSTETKEQAGLTKTKGQDGSTKTMKQDSLTKVKEQDSSTKGKKDNGSTKAMKQSGSTKANKDEGSKKANEKGRLTKTKEQDGSTKTNEQDGSTKTNEQDGSTKTKDQDGSTKTKDQDELSKTNEQNGSTKTKEQDGSTKTKEQEGSTKTKEQDGSTKTKEQDEFTKTNKQDGSTKTKEQEGSTKTKEQKGSTKTKEQDGSTKTKEQDELTKTNKQDGSTKTKEQEGSTKTKEQKGSTKTKEQDGSTKTKEQDASTKTKEQDGSTKTKEQDASTKTKEQDASTKTKGDLYTKPAKVQHKKPSKTSKSSKNGDGNKKRQRNTNQDEDGSGKSATVSSDTKDKRTGGKEAGPEVASLEPREQGPLSWQGRKLERLRQRQEELIHAKEGQGGALALLTAMGNSLATKMQQARPGNYRAKLHLQASVEMLTEKARRWGKESAGLEDQHNFLTQDLTLEIKLNGKYYSSLAVLEERKAYLDRMVLEQRQEIEGLLKSLGTTKRETERMVYSGVPSSDPVLDELEMGLGTWGGYGSGGWSKYGPLRGSRGPYNGSQQLLFRDEEQLLERSLRNRYDRFPYDRPHKWEPAGGLPGFGREDSFWYPSRLVRHNSRVGKGWGSGWEYKWDGDSSPGAD